MVIVERAGQPVAVVIPVEMYERFIARREARFQVPDRILERLPNLPEEEVETDVIEAIAAVSSGDVAGRP